MGPDPTGEPVRQLVRNARFGLDVEGSGSAILFIHGFPFNRTMWRGQVAELNGWRRIAPDLRGFGFSEPAPERWSMADHADDLAGLLEGLGVEQAVVCGLSMGGYIAFEMWRRHRNRIRALVLANTRADADSPEGRKQRDTTIESVRQRGIAALLESMTPKLLAPATLNNRPEIVAHVRSMISDTAAETAVTALAALRDRADSNDLLAGIDVSTMVVAGAGDTIIPAEVHRQFAGRIPGANLQIIEGAGHLTPLEQPREFTRILVTFLQSLD